MSAIERHFAKETTERETHPLLRLLADRQTKGVFKEAVVEIRRRRGAIGYEGAVVYLDFILPDGRRADENKPRLMSSWDVDFNAVLVERGIRAVNEENEMSRFALTLNANFQKPETRFRDAYFSFVLLNYLKTGPFSESPAVQEILQYTPAFRPRALIEASHEADEERGNGFDDGETHRFETSGAFYDDCQAMIDQVLRNRWHDLTDRLRYPPDAAERILAGALAKYLDERFSISDRKKLGWL